MKRGWLSQSPSVIMLLDQTTFATQKFDSTPIFHSKTPLEDSIEYTVPIWVWIWAWSWQRKGTKCPFELGFGRDLDREEELCRLKIYYSGSSITWLQQLFIMYCKQSCPRTTLPLENFLDLNAIKILKSFSKKFMPDGEISRKWPYGRFWYLL